MRTEIANVSSWKWHKQRFIATRLSAGDNVSFIIAFRLREPKIWTFWNILSGRKSSWADAPFSDADLRAKNISHQAVDSLRVFVYK